MNTKHTPGPDAVDVLTVTEAADTSEHAADAGFAALQDIGAMYFNLHPLELPTDDEADALCDALNTYFQACARIALARIDGAAR